MEAGNDREELTRLKHVQAFFIGVDLGQVNDYSALTVLARRVEVPDKLAWTPDQIRSIYYAVVLKRFPLGTPYYLIEQEVQRIWGLPELVATENWLVVDSTGVGIPVVESMRKIYNLPAYAVTITGGETAKQTGEYEYHVSKGHLVTSMVDMVQRKRLKIEEGVEDMEEFFNQMDVFGYKVNKNTGNMSYESLQDSVHDDLVVSTALAVWMAERVHPFLAFGDSGRSHVDGLADPFAPA